MGSLRYHTTHRAVVSEPRAAATQFGATCTRPWQVVSSPAIHSIPDAAGRARAITGAVLRPGGQLLIAYIRTAGEYRDTLQQNGLADVARRSLSLGWRFWYGGPWMATTPVSATKQT